MKLNLRACAILLVLSVVACGHRKVIKQFEGDSHAEVPNVITLDVGWVKDKGKNFDAELWLKNIGSSAVVLPLGNLECAHAGHQGSARLQSFNGTSVELEPNEKKRFVLVCNLDIKQKGDFEITFNNVFARAANGGRGKLLAPKLAIKLSSAQR